jgi:hypothetical protein
VSRGRGLRGTKITGNWWDRQPNGREGKRCVIEGQASMRDVRECATICKSHWFDKDTMHSFKSRVGDKAYADGRGGAFFVSSEKGPSGVRAFSVRHYDPKGCRINTVGEFQEYKTSLTATTAAKKLAKRGAWVNSRTDGRSLRRGK